MSGDTSGDRTGVREVKGQLVKAARMYAMCRKAGVPEPMDVTGLAVAAFEDMPLKQALVFVRTNEQNLEDLAWAFVGVVVERLAGIGHLAPRVAAARRAEQ